MDNFAPLALMPMFPLFGAAVCYLLVKYLPPVDEQGGHQRSLAGFLATTCALASFAVALVSYYTLADAPTLKVHLWTWFQSGDLTVPFALTLDRLAAVMSLIVTGVGSLIHLYAIGYMAEDRDQPRFFSYLNLFLFAMLLLVLGDNLLVMFVGWEGVGLCSYLLIGFWFKEMANAEAGQKAFVVNRIGDAGFLLGIFLLFVATGTVSFTELATQVPLLPVEVIELAALLLFVGAVGKSAQIPLYVWLPDAMAGPTPVSALIHAATMVTAGIYMIVKLAFLYALAPQALTIILVVGGLTAFFAATIALVQNDIKKVLAYSTVSQLGYMFMALGAGAFSNGLYHVVTHAFFKACLFMGAGSVIIGCHHEQDMRKFGGLRKYMPWTWATYLVATLAIAGLPPLSGFFSKDAILWAVFSNTGLPSQIMFGSLSLAKLMWGLGAVTALLTAFYMTRSLVLTFHGEYRGGHSADHHSHGHHSEPHESPIVVTLPLVVLAALSLGYGYFAGEGLLHYLGEWTRSDLRGTPADEHLFHLLEYLSVAIAVAGFSLAWLVYGAKPEIAHSAARRFTSLYQTLLNKWWVDEIYAAAIVQPLRLISQGLFLIVDRSLVDGSVNSAGMIVQAGGEATRKIQTGELTDYLLWLFGAMLFFTVFWVLL